jgi:hypothetical protein
MVIRKRTNNESFPDGHTSDEHDMHAVEHQESASDVLKKRRTAERVKSNPNVGMRIKMDGLHTALLVSSRCIDSSIRQRHHPWESTN